MLTVYSDIVYRTVVNETVVENKIGDALVHRIIRAHREGTQWRACIVIPLLPGYPQPIDSADASSVGAHLISVNIGLLILK